MVYRRVHLKEKDIQFYQPKKEFVWSSFTSTTSTFPSSANFGNILFKICITKALSNYALGIAPFSAFPTEKEILLIPNIAFRVTKIITTADPDIGLYPNCTVVIEIQTRYVSLVG